MNASQRFPIPTSWWNRLAIRAAVWDDYEGVPVATTGWRELAPDTRTKIASAVRLLIEFAPAHLDRFQRLSRGIVVTRLYTADAAWRPDLSACLVDIDFLNSDRASAAAIAATVIHELTHARLMHLGVSHTDERRARIEQLCHKAEQRFLSLLPESLDRTAALTAIEKLLSHDVSFWSNDAMLRRDIFYPWYIRFPRWVLRRVRPSAQ